MQTNNQSGNFAILGSSIVFADPGSSGGARASAGAGGFTTTTVVSAQADANESYQQAGISCTPIPGSEVAIVVSSRYSQTRIAGEIILSITFNSNVPAGTTFSVSAPGFKPFNFPSQAASGNPIVSAPVTSDFNTDFDVSIVIPGGVYTTGAAMTLQTKQVVTPSGSSIGKEIPITRLVVSLG